MSDPSSRPVAVLTGSLSLQERIGRALAAQGGRAIAPTPATASAVLDAGAVALILELDQPSCDALALLAALRAEPRGRALAVAAFGPHLRADLLERARALGAEALPRGAFLAHLEDQVARLLAAG